MAEGGADLLLPLHQVIIYLVTRWRRRYQTHWVTIANIAERQRCLAQRPHRREATPQHTCHQLILYIYRSSKRNVSIIIFKPHSKPMNMCVSLFANIQSGLGVFCSGINILKILLFCKNVYFNWLIFVQTRNRVFFFKNDVHHCLCFSSFFAYIISND